MATATDRSKREIELVSIDEAQAEIAGGVKLIDVREQNEWDEAHLEAAIHVPQGELRRAPRRDRSRCVRAHAAALPHRQPLGADGRRSSQALGYGNVGVDGGRDRRLGATPGLPTVNASGPDPRAADPLLAPHAAARGRRRRAS